MKKTKKTSKVLAVILVTLLVVVGLFIFRSYILGILKIGATGETETVLTTKSETDILSEIKLGNGVNVAGAIDNTVNQKYIGLVGVGVTPTATATTTASVTTTPNNGCTKPSTVSATVTGSQFHFGTNIKSVATTNVFNFGTKDSILDPLTSNSPGLYLSRQGTFLRVKYDFNSTNQNTPVDVSIKFTGATVDSQSIKLVTKDPLESTDTYSVNAKTNTVTFHFVSERSATDIDGFAIYFYCNGVTPTPSTTPSTVRNGTITGTFDLGSTKTVTKVKINPLTTKNLNGNGTGCLTTTVDAKVSNDNSTWTNEQISGTSNILVFSQPVATRYVHYVFTLASCNQTDTPEITSAQILGYGTITTATASISPTVTSTTACDAGSASCTPIVPTVTPTVTSTNACDQGSASCTPIVPVIPSQSLIPNPAKPCEPQRPITCSAPNPVSTTTADTNNPGCLIQACVPGQNPTATVTNGNGIFNTPSGSAKDFLVNGIKSGLSFYLIVIATILIGGVIIFRILRAKD